LHSILKLLHELYVINGAAVAMPLTATLSNS